MTRTRRHCCDTLYEGSLGGQVTHDGLARIARIAMGRLGGRLSPWLDEGLLMGRGLATLLELLGDPALREAGGEARDDESLVRWAVGGMRSWARASSWFRRAWPCRIAPLCASLASRGDDCEETVAEDLGLRPSDLADRYTEAGLVFAVSPELMLVEPARGDDRGCSLLSRTISGRPVEQRRVLTLYFQEGLSFPEIAELLDLSGESVQRHYGRAAASIRSGVVGGSEPVGVGG